MINMQNSLFCNAIADTLLEQSLGNPKGLFLCLREKIFLKFLKKDRKTITCTSALSFEIRIIEYGKG